MSPIDDSQLTPQEIAQLKRLLSHPEHFPDQFKKWLPSYLEVNPPSLLGSNVNPYFPGVVKSSGLELKVPTSYISPGQEVIWKKGLDGSKVAELFVNWNGGVWYITTLQNRALPSETSQSELKAYTDRDALGHVGEFAYVTAKATGDGHATVSVIALGIDGSGTDTLILDEQGRSGFMLRDSALAGRFRGLLTSPPASPIDGDWFILQVDATNGINWVFYYRAASGSGYKWEFIGGPPLYSEIQTDESTSSTPYVDLATAGPSVTVPRAGDYFIDFHANTYNTSGGLTDYVSVKLGAAGTSDNESDSQGGPGNPSTSAQTARRGLVRTLAASDVVKMQYGTNGGTFHARWRNLSVSPVRIS